MMFLSALLLAYSTVAILGKALPREETSIVSAKPPQAVLNDPNAAHRGKVVTVPSPEQRDRTSHVQAVVAEGFDRAPLTAVLADSLPWLRELRLSSSCKNSWLGRWMSVPFDTCLNITDPYLMITKSAICPDGTHAKLAVYYDEQCSSMAINTQLQDEMVGSCLQTDVALEFFRGFGWGKMKSLKVLCQASPEYDKSLSQNASIKLFAASTTPVQPTTNDSCTGTAFNTVSLPADHCLSGDYYLNSNMLIVDEAICRSGQYAISIYYHARNCVGKIQYTSGGGSPTICIWNHGIPQPRYWSMIWRCGGRPDLFYQQGAEHHQVAISPPAPRPDAPRSAVVIPCHPSASTGQVVSTNPNIIVPTGECLATPGCGIQILETAVCENGTRAQWARFEDVRCGGGVISTKYGLADISDEDVGKCLSTRPVGSMGKIRSMAFWCDEIQP